ncbi:MAG: hypothetical protein U0Q16_20885 [Bryobacteraceae bacterium]
MLRAIALLAAGLAIPGAAADLRVGRAAVKITPPAGIPMAGYYSVRLAEGTLDDLHAKALVIELNGAKAAMVACDVVSLERDIVEQARKLAEERTGIPAAQILISATHSHTGPLMHKRLIAPAPPAAQKLALAYRAALPGKIADAIKAADSALGPAQASRAAGREDSISFYRRFLMKDGTVKTNPGKANPDIVQPMGEIDPEVAVVRFDSPDGKPQAAYVNFSLHLDTTGGPQFSADYPATLAKLLGKIHGPDLLTMFTIAAAGNINHVDVKSKEPQKGPAEARRIGTILAGEVIKAMARLQPVDAANLRFAREVLTLPMRSANDAEVAKAKEIAAQINRKPQPPFLDLVQSFAVLNAHDLGKLEAEVQVIALGDKVAWVGLPGEIFVELGAAIKKASPFPQTIIVELANGTLRYVPTKKGFAEGAYEATNSLCAPGGGEQLADTAIRLLAQAYRAGR